MRREVRKRTTLKSGDERKRRLIEQIKENKFVFRTINKDTTTTKIPSHHYGCNATPLMFTCVFLSCLRRCCSPCRQQERDPFIDIFTTDKV